MADVAILNKVDAARPEQVASALASFRTINPGAPVLRAASPIVLDAPQLVRGKRVLVVEDGPTTTHGGMGYGAGRMGALAAGAAEIVDPRPGAAPAIAEVLDRYPHLEHVVPAMGYSDDELEALRTTLEASAADVVVSGSPLDLGRLIEISKPIVRARYHYQDLEEPGLAGVVDDFLTRRGLGTSP
jgi:predicted GTPase